MITNDQSGNNLSTFDLFIVCLVFVVQQGTLQSVPPSLLSFLSLPLKYIQGVWISVLSTSFLCFFSRVKHTIRDQSVRIPSANLLSSSLIVVALTWWAAGHSLFKVKVPFYVGGLWRGVVEDWPSPAPLVPPALE